MQQCHPSSSLVNKRMYPAASHKIFSSIAAGPADQGGPWVPGPPWILRFNKQKKKKKKF